MLVALTDNQITLYTTGKGSQRLAENVDFMTETLSPSGGEIDLASIDREFRIGTPAKEIAVLAGQTPTGLYPHLTQRGVAVATLRFLVDARTGRPLTPIIKGDISGAGDLVAKRRRKLT